MKTPYNERSDLDKIKSQWHKLTGLHSREEWSEAVVRAATAAEIAANYAIRAEFAKVSSLTPEFVDSLLKWANGLRGKMLNLLIPLVTGTERAPMLAQIKALAEVVNDDRNKIVHRGEFRGAEEPRATIESARQFIEGLVRLYKPKFRLKERAG
jgi:hypothetical protein